VRSIKTYTEKILCALNESWTGQWSWDATYAYCTWCTLRSVGRRGQGGRAPLDFHTWIMM